MPLSSSRAVHNCIEPLWPPSIASWYKSSSSLLLLRAKVLYFDGAGLWVLSKRLERGTFSWPKPGQAESPTLKLSPEAFAMPTDGVDLRGAKLRPWYERE